MNWHMECDLKTHVILTLINRIHTNEYANLERTFRKIFHEINKQNIENKRRKK